MSLVKRFRCLPFVVLFVALAAGGEPGATKKATDGRVAELIAQLGSDEFEVREKAGKELAERDEALPALRRATQAADPEVRRAAERLVAVLEARLEERFVRESVARVNEEGLDLFIDRMVLQKGYATPARWKAVVELAKALARRAAQTGATIPNILEQDFLALPEVTPAQVGAQQAARIRGEGVEHGINVLHGCVLLGSGSWGSFNSTDRSILLVNGDIKSLNSTRNSIIICSGTIKSFNSTRGCLVFCNGLVESMNSTEGNAVFVRGELRRLNFTRGNVIEATALGQGNLSQGNTYLNRKTVEAHSREDRFVPADPSLLDFFRFFDPARIGLEFTMVEGDAQAEKVRDGKPFARAGLRKGDRVLAVDREKFVSADGFTRLLRRKVIEGKALLKVQRGDRILEILVRFEP